MKAIIFHGTGDRAGSYWQGWLKDELEKNGFAVDMPYYPDINQEPIDTFLPKVLAAHKFDSDTVLVGHSAGGPLILSILEHLEAPIAQAVLVAGYSWPDKNDDPILQKSYDWHTIKSNSQDFVFINSANDPWGCDDKQGRALFDNLGGTLIVRNEGHFGSVKFNQLYQTFPLLRDVILENAK